MTHSNDTTLTPVVKDNEHTYIAVRHSHAHFANSHLSLWDCLIFIKQHIKKVLVFFVLSLIVTTMTVYYDAQSVLFTQLIAIPTASASNTSHAQLNVISSKDIIANFNLFIKRQLIANHVLNSNNTLVLTNVSDTDTEIPAGLLRLTYRAPVYEKQKIKYLFNQTNSHIKKYIVEKMHVWQQQFVDQLKLSEQHAAQLQVLLTQINKQENHYLNSTVDTNVAVYIVHLETSLLNMQHNIALQKLYLHSVSKKIGPLDTVNHEEVSGWVNIISKSVLSSLMITLIVVTVLTILILTIRESVSSQNNK